MDPTRFEDMTRRFAAATTRRHALQVLAASAFGTAVGMLRPGAGDASRLVKGCKIPGQKCKGKGRGPKTRCCGDMRCRNKRCQCIKRGGSCLVPIDPEAGLFLPSKALCCSSRCGRKDNKCR